MTQPPIRRTKADRRGPTAAAADGGWHAAQVLPAMCGRVRAAFQGWWIAAAAIVLATCAPARAQDPEGCLTCHRYRGLAAINQDAGEIELFYVDPNYYGRAMGPHARLRCTQCHERSQVEVVPHHPVSPVNCTQQCHMIGAEGVEIPFSHARISEMLDTSVHDAETLREVNRLMGHPLAEGQADCLLCHDEPLFQRPEEIQLHQTAPIDRCNVCHSEVFPLDTRYFYWHVFARSRTARSKPDTVRLCAVCHHRPDVQEASQLGDTIASYLFSFHGKAMLLGSDQTAGCLDCHVSPMQNVHVMQSHVTPTAPTHPDRLADTCRSPECHPQASAQMTSAAVHLELASGRGIEFIVAVIFIGMIIFTFGPSVLLTALEMLNLAVGRTDPGVREREHLAEELLEDREGRRHLRRFNTHQRMQHWGLMILFTTLVLTGFPLKFADRGWAASLIDAMGGIEAARLLHRIAGTLLILGFIYHIIYVTVLIVQTKRREKVGVLGAILRMPLAVTPRDLKHMLELHLYLFGLRKSRPESGRFKMEQKFEYFGVFWGTMLLGITGVLMWFSDWTTYYLPGRALTLAYLIHGFEAFLALLHVGVVHMVGVIFSPVVFPISPAMFTGLNRPEDLAESHGEWIEEARRRVEATRSARGGEASHA